MRPIYGADYGHNAPNNPGGRIVVDFNYGTPVHPAHSEMAGSVPTSGRTGAYADRSDARTHRRLSSLLRYLIESPAFGNSDQIIETDGHNGIAARDFFIPMRSADQRYLGQFGGYWGLISDVRFSDDRRTLWFNGGGQSNFSFCLDSEFVGDLNQRYRVADEEDLAGAYILVIGVLRISHEGKLYCVIEDVGSMALRPT